MVIEWSWHAHSLSFFGAFPTDGTIAFDECGCGAMLYLAWLQSIRFSYALFLCGLRGRRCNIRV